MRRTSLLGLALAGSLTLAGCTAGGFPLPTASPSGSASPTASAPVVEETDAPTTVAPLPASALLRLSVTADAGDQEVRLVLTFDRADGATSAVREFDQVLEACPNAVDSQLELFPGQEPVGVLTSALTTAGEWPEGLRIAIVTGGHIAAIGDGSGVEPALDPAAGFGCTVPVVSGPGSASFVSLLIGDPAKPLRANLDAQLEQGLYGIQSDAGSQVEVTWKNCVVQLSTAAEKFAEDNGWLLPADWQDGCLIGAGGAV